MNVIVTAFAFKENYGNSMQLTEKDDTSKIALYMKNIVVCLTSAKQKNPECEVMLVTNHELEEPYRSILCREGIVIRLLAYDRYEMPRRFAWALAFYKLRVLEYLAEGGAYDKILLLDNDTICMDSLIPLWEEAEYGMLLYPVGHAFRHPEREIIRSDYRRLYPDEDANIVHYGGEFICGRSTVLAEFMKECSSVYQRMADRDYPVAENIGDETILAVAAARYKARHTIYEAGAYLQRYWTVKRFYLVATNTVCNPVAVWHLPAEKDRGFLLMYEYYSKHGNYPEREKAAEMFGIIKAKRPVTMSVLRSNLLQWKCRKSGNSKK